ncbi:MAG: hydrogenase maturation nickel metallochaperone HypA [Candidatus Melainabacteria bacterium]|nr:hydrogenase maturation nickel metallochaperone HypA [Candidatus Melainabacteria bacterium]
MHEAKIASLILEKASNKLSLFADANEVKSIQLAVGKFRNIDTESLNFAFDALKSENRIFERTTLIIDEIEAIAICQENGHSYRIDFTGGFACPICGGGIGKFESGQELEIRKIQLTSEEKNA